MNAGASHCISEYESASYCRFEPDHLRVGSSSSGSLVCRFVFWLDFLLVVPNIERNFGKNGLTQSRQSDIRNRGQLSKFHLSAILATLRASGAALLSRNPRDATDLKA
jgi:hypothetical protein